MQAIIDKFLNQDSTNSGTQAEINDIKGRLDVNELNISNALNRIGLNEQQIVSILAAITALQSKDVQHTDSIDANSADITDLQQATVDNKQGIDAINSFLPALSASILTQVNENDLDIDAIRSEIENITISGGLAIGDAEDGIYNDGLFTDFTPTTPVGTAVDRFNEVLKSLAPASPDRISSISYNNGVDGYLSFGSSNTIPNYTNHPTKDVDDLVGNSANELGIFNATSNISGTLANNQSQQLPSYPNNSFAQGNEGVLELVLNGSVVHSVDLSAFSSGDSFNSNGSGFTLTSATPVKFSNGDEFQGSQYRTGSYRVDYSDQQLGYNALVIRHDVSGSVASSQTIFWIVDGSTDLATYSSSLSNINFSGLQYLSGVKYYTNGTVDYDVTISNLYKNTYSTQNINFTETNFSNVSNQSIPSIGGGDENSDVNISKTLTINANRLIGQVANIRLTPYRTVQGVTNSPREEIQGILMDKLIDNGRSTDLVEFLDDEDYRVDESFLGDLNFADYKTDNTYAWDSTEDLNSKQGLMLLNGELVWPQGNFNSYSNGPSSNVNYSGINSGTRTYYRYFTFGEFSNVANFIIDVDSSNTTFVNTLTALTGNRAQMEIFVPATTSVNNNLSFKDVYQNYVTDESAGCYAANIPVSSGQVGCTLGAKSTFNAKGVVILKITTSNEWVGDIKRIEFIAV